MHELLGVFRLVKLALRVVDSDLAEQPFHAEGAGFIGDDRDDALTERLVAGQRGHQPHHRDHGGDFAIARPLGQRLETFPVGHFERRCLVDTRGQRAPQLLAALPEVAHLGTVLGGFDKRQLPHFLIGNGNVQPVAVGPDGLVAHFLLLVGNVFALPGLAHAVALDGLHEDHRGPALVLDRRLVGGVELHRIVATAIERPDLLVAQIRHHRLQLG